MKLRVDYCPVDRIEELMAFIGSAWKPDHIFSRDAELLRWQHRHRSDPGLLTVLLAEDDAGPVGALGVIHADYCWRGERMPSGWLALWFTKKGARGAPGLALIRAVMAGEDRMIGTARFVEAPRRVYEGMGFRVLNAIPRWVVPIDAGVLDALLREAADPVPDPFGSYRLLLDADSGAALRVEPWSPGVEGDWDDVWLRDFAPRFQGVCRDAAFLRWRYLEHPRWKYRVSVARRGTDGRPRGIAVSRVEPLQGRKESVYRILDLLAVDADCGAALAHALCTDARQCGTAFADFYCTRAESAAPLEALGFVREDRLPRPLPALFQPLDFRPHAINAAFWMRGRADATEVFSHPDLYVTRIEGDQDRPN